MDYLYIILVLPTILLSLFASGAVKSTYAKYSRVLSKRGITGREAAESVLLSNGVSDVAIGTVSGELTDHYNTSNNTINLSDGIYGSTSVAALGIACHEAGHAVQHNENYFPIKVRNAILPVAQLGSSLSIPLIFIGFLLNTFMLCEIGIILFGAVVAFQLVTLPVEFNASARAMTALRESAMLDEEELKMTKKVLTAAAMTYVAALLLSAVQLLRFVIMARGRNRR